jgi:predicted amidophosphoribosyltransferase
MFLELRCAGCDRPGAALCRVCRFALVGASSPRPGPGGAVAAVEFSGRAREIVLGLKYRNRRAVAAHLAGLLTRRLLDAGLRPEQLDVVTWAPTGGPRRRQRGFDQAELVARRVARQLGLPCRRLVAREAGSGPQTGRTRAERLDGPGFRSRPLSGRPRVLVVDDVVTTGATLAAAERALREAGARSVVRAAVATTPARPQRAARPGGRVLVGPWVAA